MNGRRTNKPGRGQTSKRREEVKGQRRTSAAALISCNVRSLPPTMLNTMPVASLMGKSSNGEAMAAAAASWGRMWASSLKT